MDRTFQIIWNYQELHTEVINIFDFFGDAHNWDSTKSQAQLSFTLLGLHAALEILVKDVIKNYLEHHLAPGLEEISKIQIKYSDIEDNKVFSSVLKVLYDKTDHKLGMLLRYRDVIRQKLNLDIIDLTKDEENNLKEFTSIRNIIAHNNRYIDNDFLRNAPWLAPKYSIGERFIIGQYEFLTYINVIFLYLDSTIIHPFTPMLDFNISIKGFDFNLLSNISLDDHSSIKEVVKNHHEKLAKLLEISNQSLPSRNKTDP